MVPDVAARSYSDLRLVLYGASPCPEPMLRRGMEVFGCGFYHGYGMTAERSGEYAEDLAATMLASTLGIEFDPDAAWNERKLVYETSQLIIGSSSVTAAAEGDGAGRWTCAVAAAVFRFA